MSTDPSNLPPEVAALLATALDIAASAPAHQGAAVRAGVPWFLIHELRERFDAYGVDVLSFKKEHGR